LNQAQNRALTQSKAIVIAEEFLNVGLLALVQLIIMQVQILCMLCDLQFAWSPPFADFEMDVNDEICKIS
jgi:hypothetical protein